MAEHMMRHRPPVYKTTWEVTTTGVNHSSAALCKIMIHVYTETTLSRATGVALRKQLVDARSGIEDRIDLDVNLYEIYVLSC